MSKTINVNIRMDEELKKQAEQLFNELGMNMTTAFNVFIRQAIRTGGIPFEVTTRKDDFYNDYNQQILKKSIESLEQGNGKVHELIEVD
ncbi:DNA-damage-inducible protein J [Clostridium butyricum]|uniref:DNA-damage-inducible protein J n=1 Tax=Clostridium butyricum TaxID=1492 RepID=A0A512TSP7_CLOBU|nr:type II toxin-antitoxin system RelB/DinJ family antitoxin [Clostridium butyricum]NOW25524.1 DNA-damage-inducible protein J [Clostridium butyricum]GEQ23276.1 DNA-damage-inducible protein J [Clostridium butyricum]